MGQPASPGEQLAGAVGPQVPLPEFCTDDLAESDEQEQSLLQGPQLEASWLIDELRDPEPALQSSVGLDVGWCELSSVGLDVGLSELEAEPLSDSEADDAGGQT